MDIGISFNPRAYGGEKMYKILSEAGFKAIDFGMANVALDPYYNLPEEEWIEYTKRQRKQIEDLGMYVNQVHGPWKYPPRDGTPEERDELFGKICITLHAAQVIGAKYMVIHPIMPFGAETMPPEKKDENYAINMEFFRRVCDEAGKRDIIVCLENMPMVGFGIARPREIYEFIKDMNHPNMKMCLDTGHATFFKDVDLVSDILKYGDVIKTLHIHDNKGVLDDHTYPYFGDIDWDGIAKSLKAVGYDGVFNLETDNPSRKLPLEIQAEIYKLHYHIAQYIVKQITE